MEDVHDDDDDENNLFAIFEKKALERPTLPAVVFHAAQVGQPSSFASLDFCQSLTYGQLYAQSSLLARAIRQAAQLEQEEEEVKKPRAGLHTNTPPNRRFFVGLYLKPSCELIIGVLGYS